MTLERMFTPGPDHLHKIGLRFPWKILGVLGEGMGGRVHKHPTTYYLCVVSPLFVDYMTFF